LGYPLGIAVDQESVYWTNYEVGFGSVMQVALSGGTPITIASAQDGPFGIGVDGTSVYWTNVTSGSVVKATPK
jgi:hypothetical protein